MKYTEMKYTVFYVEKFVNDRWALQKPPINGNFPIALHREVEPPFINCAWLNSSDNFITRVFWGDTTGFPCVMEKLPINYGLPIDVSDLLKEKYREGHKYSSLRVAFVSLDAINALHDRMITYSGYLDVKSFAKYIKTGEAPTWYYPEDHFDILNNEIIVSNEEMNSIIKMMAFYGDEKFFTKVQWEVPFHKNAAKFYADIFDDMKKISSSNDYQDVRCIYWEEV